MVKKVEKTPFLKNVKTWSKNVFEVFFEVMVILGGVGVVGGGGGSKVTKNGQKGQKNTFSVNVKTRSKNDLDSAGTASKAKWRLWTSINICKRLYSEFVFSIFSTFSTFLTFSSFSTFLKFFNFFDFFDFFQLFRLFRLF